MTNQITLAATIYCIEDSRPKRITVSIFTGSDWLHHELGEPLRAIRSLLELLSQPELQFKDRYSACPCSVKELPVGSPFRELLALVSGVNRPQDIDPIRNLLRAKFDSRYLFVVASNADAARLTFNEIGDGFTYLDERWRSMSVGRRIETLPDFNYSVSTAQAYHSVRTSRSPLLEDVDVFLDPK
jgi:hypothetical protein